MSAEGGGCRLRMLVPALFFFAVLAGFTVRLALMQLSGGSSAVLSPVLREEKVTVKAARGMICDRNGTALVSTVQTYSATLSPDYATADNGTLNALVRVMLRCGVKRESDTFFRKKTAAGSVVMGTEYMSAGAYADYMAILEDAGIAPYLSYDEILTALGARYDLSESDFSDDGYLQALCFRYDMERAAMHENAFVFADDLSTELLAALSELRPAGLDIRSDVGRVYHYPGYASQILGRVGLIQADDVAYYTELGYPLDAIVGVDGAERQFETLLAGKDGVMVNRIDQQGNVVESYMETEPVAGHNVWLTLDITVQKAAEDALAANIEQIVSLAKAGTTPLSGEDASAGALVLLNPNNGEILAMASNPTFNLSTFSADYAALSANPDKPFVNRVLNGTYAPGSIFKVSVATAALEEGLINRDTTIFDEGIYSYYDDYRPRCWIYTRTNGAATHGEENVVGALRDSCNYFFFEVGRQLGIERIVSYAQRYGLGEPTGVELPESVGTLAGVNRGGWTPGNTLAAAIGQMNHLFTPLELASYLATAVNGGTRYAAHLYLKTTVFFTGEVLDEPSPAVLSTVPMSEETHSLLIQGLSEVVENGSAVRIFGGYPVAVGGKTGTAEVGSQQSANALFAAFAPIEQPQLVAVSVIENGAAGTNAGYCVRDAFNAYFKFENGNP